MNKKELKRALKLYKSDLNSMADESIKYKKLAERATADCVRLVTILQEYRERTNRAENMVERLINEGCVIAERLSSCKKSEKLVIDWDMLVGEWDGGEVTNA